MTVFTILVPGARSKRYNKAICEYLVIKKNQRRSRAHLGTAGCRATTWRRVRCAAGRARAGCACACKCAGRAWRHARRRGRSDRAAPRRARRPRGRRTSDGLRGSCRPFALLCYTQHCSIIFYSSIKFIHIYYKIAFRLNQLFTLLTGIYLILYPLNIITLQLMRA